MVVREIPALFEELGKLLACTTKAQFHSALSDVLQEILGTSCYSVILFDRKKKRVEVQFSRHEAVVAARERRAGFALGESALDAPVSGLLVDGEQLPARELGRHEVDSRRTALLLVHENITADSVDAAWWTVVMAAYCGVDVRETTGDRLSRSLAKIEAINFIGELIGSLDLEVLLSKLMEISLFLSSAQVGSVFLDEDGELSSRVEWGLTLDQALELKHSDGESILERTVRTGQPQLIDDYRDATRFAPVAGVDVVSYLSVPLVSKGKVLGAINLINPETQLGRFTETDLDSIFTIAGLAATTIENAILHKDSLEKERITEGLRIAQTIQNGMYPKEKPRVQGYEVAWINSSCDETGGDYFDFIETDTGSLFLTIGDVVGHGIGAALLMATARANLRALCSVQTELQGVIESLNRFLENDMDEEQFMTMFVGRLDLTTHRLEFVNAGHDKPIVYRAARRSTECLDTTGLPLGVFAEAPYDVDSVAPLEVGDAILLTTDGVWEVRDPAGDLFGKERLRELFASTAGAAPGDLLETIHRTVVDFVGPGEFADDVTMVTIKRVQ